MQQPGGMDGLTAGMQGLGVAPIRWQDFPIAPGVQALFAEADADGDSQVGRGDAKQFFVRTGVPGALLAKIWSRCHFSPGEGLTLPEFAMALRLCALAQSGHEFSTENMERALEPQRTVRLPALAPRSTSSVPAPPPPPVAQPPPLPQLPRRSAGSSTSLDSGGGGSPLSSSGPPPVCPPSVDVRPQPLRPRAAAKLRVLCCTAAGSLWAGPSLRGGMIRYPDVTLSSPLGTPFSTGGSAGDDLLAAPPPQGCGEGGAFAAQGEDVDAEPCGEYSGPPSVAAANMACLSSGGVTCVCFEPARGLVWTGHADGRVCSWRAEAAPRGQAPGLGAGVVASWQAHKGPVAAALLSHDGSLWSGGKGGTLRVWHPGITLAGPAQSAAPQSAAAALAGALSGPAVADGARTLTRRDGNKPHQELRGLADCMHGARELVWSAGTTSFVMWCARSYTALRVITPDGSPVPDIPPEEAAEREGGGGGGGGGLFGRLSKAVERRVQRANEYLDGADVGTSPGGPRILSLTAAPWGGLVASLEVQTSGTGVSASAGGGSTSNLAGTAAGGVPSAGAPGADTPSGPTYLVQRYATDGTPAENATVVPAPVRAMQAAVAPAAQQQQQHLMWVGLANGAVLVIEADGPGGGSSHVRVLATWQAHKGGVLSCTCVPGRVFTLGDDGAIRGWPWNGALASPGVASTLSRYVAAISTQVQLRVFTGTWNVAEKRPDPRSLRAWLGDRVEGCDIAALGMQEIEKLNASSVGASAAKELVGMGDTLNANAVWWQSALLTALEEATATTGGGPWDCLAARQLSGALVLVYVRRRLAPALGAPLTASAACGIMGVGGNKGGVGVRVSVHRKSLVFVNTHLAAHQNAVRKRNDNVATISNNLMFEPQLSEFWRSVQQKSAAPERISTSSAASAAKDNDDESGDDEVDPADAKAAAGKRVSLPPAGGLGDADLLLFFGDMNYRIDVSYDEATSLIARGDLAALAKQDQCSKERAAGRVFQEPRLHEGPLAFPPTYKFDKGTSTYDSSEKKRIPAWCDRVLWADASAAGVTAELLAYESVMEVCESDHKPVRQLMRVTLLACEETKKRRAVVAALLGQAVQQPLVQAAPAPMVGDLLSL